MQKQILQLKRDMQAVMGDKTFLENQLSDLEGQLKRKDEIIKEKEMDNEKSEQARRDLKIDLEEMNAKLTQLEEELYGSKTEQLDLLQ